MVQPWNIAPKLNIAKKCAIIIGGGLAGTSAAYALVKKGWEVTLIERSAGLASGASGNPAGILSPMITHKKDPIGKFYLQGFEYSLRLLKELSEFLPSTVQFNNCGVIELGAGKVNKDLNENVVPNTDIEKLSQAETTKLCGVELHSAGLHIEKGCWVSPESLCRANIAACGENIKVIFSSNIISMAKSESGWAVIDSSGKVIASAPVAIIGNASDANNFVQTSWIPMHKVRGQLTYLPSMGLKLQKILCYDGGYISPEIDGFNYVGATYSRTNMSSDVTVEDHMENINNLRKAINIGDINYSELKGRVSFRATIPDRRPVIGAVPDIAAFYEDYADLKHGRRNKNYPQAKYLVGLYISTGYGSRGLSACLIGGETLAAMINNEELPIDEEISKILNPSRFIIKKLQSGA